MLETSHLNMCNLAIGLHILSGYGASSFRARVEGSLKTEKEYLEQSQRQLKDSKNKVWERGIAIEVLQHQLEEHECRLQQEKMQVKSYRKDVNDCLGCMRHIKRRIARC